MSAPPISPTMPSPDPMQQDLSWLASLSSQPIFSAQQPATTPSTMLLRGSDVIVLADGELRVASLSALKNSVNARPHGSTSKPYKVLSNAIVTEALSSPKASHVTLALNAAKTLLAISLPTSLILVILPRSASISAAGTSTINVKAHKLGSFYHNAHSPRAEHIVSTKWHPWSKRATSLMVLLRNGNLLEYDVARDTKEPQQTLALLPASNRAVSPHMGLGSRRSRSIFAQEDSDDEEGQEAAAAVSFTLGISDNGEYAPDWLPLTVYVLTKSGDVYAAAPFLPRHARVPAAYLHSLSSFVQESTEGGKQREYSLRFVSNLLKQAKAYQDEQASQAMSDEAGGPNQQSRSSTPAAWMGFGHRSQRSRSVVSMSLDPQGEDVEEDEDTTDVGPAEHVEVKSPVQPLVPGSAVCQGPFLLAPAPHELSETREGQGSDLAYVRLPGTAETKSSLDVLLLVSDDGRVDVGSLDVSGKVLPKWSSQETTSRSLMQDFGRSLRLSQSKVRKSKTGRYGLDDSSSDDDDDDVDEDDDGEEAIASLPTLFVYETLDLGFPQGAASLRPVPRIVLDAVYPDTFYVHHAFGAHMVSLSAWADSFAELLHQGDGDELTRFLHASRASQAKWIVRIQDAAEQTSEDVGREGVSKVEVVDDIYLGYSLLILLGDGDCFGVELGMRAPSLLPGKLGEEGDASELTADASSSNSRKYYTSLLGSEPFVPPAPFNDSSAAFPSTRLKTTSGASKNGKDELRVTPESLRLLGTTVQDLRGQMRQVVQGGNTIQSRLELQIKELERQLNKLNDIHARLISHRKDSPSPTSLADRITRVNQRQKALISRVDRVLQRSMDAAEGSSNNTGRISKYEEAWMREMIHMEGEIGSEGLAARVEKLKGQLQDLKPDLYLVKEDLSQRRHGNLGAKQLDKVLAVLAIEADRLGEAKDKVQSLNRAVARVRA